MTGKTWPLPIPALIAAAILMAGCGKSGQADGRSTADNRGFNAGGQKSVAQVLQEQMEENDNQGDDFNILAETDKLLQSYSTDPEMISDDGKEEIVLSTVEGIDIDLTSLSATMVYTEVYDMNYDPESYIGKVIRMEGLFSAYQDPDSGAEYFACIIQDAAACCAQGIEFVLAGEHTYPEDYPSPGDMVTVTGVFDTYMEDGLSFNTLRDAVMD